MNKAKRALFVSLFFCCIASSSIQAQTAPNNTMTQANTNNAQAEMNNKDVLISETSDEKSQGFWGKFYIASTAIGLVVAACGLGASYQTFVFSNKVSASQKVQISVANQLAQEANERAQQLEVQAAQLRAANLRLEQQMAWRRITPDQVESLVSALRPFAGQKILLASIMGDTEGLIYRKDFQSTFEKAGWTDDPKTNVQAAFNVPPIGLQVEVNPADAPDNEDVLRSAFVLASTLYDLKIIPNLGMARDPTVPQGSIRLLVGAKPPPQPP